jgi:nucleotide-binding universal stress UspA family protein
VLIATDLSEAADIAVREGAAMADRPADALAVVHVIPSMVREGYFSTRDDQREAQAKQVVERATRALRDRVKAAAPQAELFVDEGRDYASIVRRAETWRADVVVLGSHGRTGLSRVLGDVADKVVRHAHCSVLVARPSTARGWVLAATDLSEPSLAAVKAAGAEARRRGAQLRVVQAVGLLHVEVSYLLEPSISRQGTEFDSMRAMLREAVAKLGVEATCDILDAPAASAIVREAEALGAELVVVGMRGRTGLSRIGIGSVAEKVVRAAPCSVLVAR